MASVNIGKRRGIHGIATLLFEAAPQQYSHMLHRQCVYF